MRNTTLGLLIAASTLAACQAGGPPSASPETGTLVVEAVFEPPTGNEPISIGGYAYFASVGELVEQQIPFDGALRVHLPVGTHPLTIVTRPQSDVVTIVDGEEQQPEVYDITAECAEDIEIAAGSEVRLTYRAVGGSECEIVVSEE